MSGPKCATVTATNVTESLFRFVQEQVRQAELARRAREERVAEQLRDELLAASARRARLQARLDESRKRIADLDFVLPELPGLPAQGSNAAWSGLIKKVERQVETMSRALDAAIASGEERLRQRLRTRNAWERHHELLEEAAQASSAAAANGDRVREAPDTEALTPKSPAPTASVDEVLQANETLVALLTQLHARIERCRDQRVADRALADAVKGWTAVRGVVGGDEESLRVRRLAAAKAHELFETELSAQLRAMELREDELPASTCSTLADIRQGRSTALGADVWVRLGRLSRRRKQRRSAELMLASPPVLDDIDIRQQWHGLRDQLELAALGAADLPPELEREHADLLQRDHLRMAERHRHLATVLALEECGFVQVQRDDLFFDGAGGERHLFTLPGFTGHRVLVQTIDDQMHWVPFRSDDANDAMSQRRDAEFDQAACSRLHRAIERLAREGELAIGAVANLAAPAERQVLSAGEMAELGVHVVPAGHCDRARSASATPDGEGAVP